VRTEISTAMKIQVVVFWVTTPISHKYTALEPYLQLAKMFMLMQFIQDVMCLFSTSCEFAFHKRNTKIKSEEIR